MISAGRPSLPTDCRTSRELVRPTSLLTASVDCHWPMRTMQHEAAIGLHRAAEIDRQVGQALGFELDVDFFEQAGQIHVDRAVDDDAQRTVLVVLADIDQGVGKIRIFHRRHGDQEMVGQVDAVHEWNFNRRQGTNQPCHKKKPSSGFAATCATTTTPP